MQSQLETVGVESPPPPGIQPLMRELLAAHRCARQPELSEALAACGLRPDCGPVWGVDFVTVDAHHYAPSLGGKPAVIIPVFDCDGSLMEIVDLVACGLETRAIRTRCGFATVLGKEWLDFARETGGTARLFADPVEWLRNRGCGAVLLDMRAACFALADVPVLSCSDELLAARIDRAMRQPVHVPRLIARGSTAPQKAERQAPTESQVEWAAKTAAHKIRMAVTETHPFLDRIGFPRMKGLVHEGRLLVPLRLDGRIVSLHEIEADGTANFLADGRMAGASFSIGSGRDEILCAGYAAALSIKAALAAVHLPARVTCCFTASNIATVAERRPNAVVLADNDEPAEQYGGLGTGEFYARRSGLRWAMPPEIGTDANDYHLGEGLPALQRLLLDLLKGRLVATESVADRFVGVYSPPASPKVHL